MKETRSIMGMHITVEIDDPWVNEKIFNQVFDYFIAVDKRFSTYKETSEIMCINRGEISESSYSSEMREIFELAEKTKKETQGYFNIRMSNQALDPSGIVKGWAIQNAAKLLLKKGFKDFYVDAGGDIQSHGLNAKKEEWTVGIRNPFKPEEIIKRIVPKGMGVATSGTYLRGQHIYNPHAPEKELHDIVSLTVIGPNILEADRFATAAFAMGKEGIIFIEGLEGFEGYAIDSKGIATMTTGFESFTIK